MMAPVRRSAALSVMVSPGFVKDTRLVTGCQPINVLGVGKLNEGGGYDYAWGRLLELTTVDQDMWEFVTSGEVFDGFGAGPVRAAVGVSWRDESIANISDPSQPDYARRDYLIQYGESFGGDVSVFEYFAEVQLPFTETFDVQLAARNSEYENTAGLGTPSPGQTFKYDFTTWKVTGNWQATDSVRLRGSLSRDLRAPNFRELYYGQDLQRGVRSASAPTSGPATSARASSPTQVTPAQSSCVVVRPPASRLKNQTP